MAVWYGYGYGGGGGDVNGQLVLIVPHQAGYSTYPTRFSEGVYIW